MTIPLTPGELKRHKFFEWLNKEGSILESTEKTTTITNREP